DGQFWVQRDTAIIDLPASLGSEVCIRELPRDRIFSWFSIGPYAGGLAWRWTDHGRRASQRAVVVRGTPSHLHSSWHRAGVFLALCSIFLLSVEEDGDRLVCAVRFGDGFDRRGSDLQARRRVSQATRDGTQGRACIAAPGDPIHPGSAPIVSDDFILRLCDRHRRHRDLGLWGPAALTGFLAARNLGPSGATSLVRSTSGTRS